MKNRSIIKMFLLFLVTFGIYRLYWLASTRNELVAKGFKVPAVWIYIGIYGVFIFSLLGMIGASFYNYSPEYGDCLDNVYNTTQYCADKYSDSTANAFSLVFLTLFYVSATFILPLIGLWYWKYAQAVDGVSKGKMSFPVAMLILLAVPDGFDMLLIQDSLNKVR